MLSGDFALVRRHLPEPVGQLFDRRYRGVAIDRCTAVARALGQRLRQIGRLDIAVIRMLDRAKQAIRSRRAARFP